jgi:1-deoxy-D-xylulose-5-phosphate reductoisomerase
MGRNPHMFEVVALTGNNNVDALAELAVRHHAAVAVVGDDRHYAALKSRLAGTGIEAGAGAAALAEAAMQPADCVVAGISGAAGLRPTLAAVSQGRRVALANKECLVLAGRMFMQAVRDAGTELVPVDSEHSAVFQAIAGGRSRNHRAHRADGLRWAVSHLETGATCPCHARGGAVPPQLVDGAQNHDRLGHPDEQGAGADRGLPSVPVTPAQLEVVVHPQSIVHALVEFCDGSMLAQLASPDMRTPIALGLAWPARMPAPTKRLDLVEVAQLSFERPDEGRFQALGLARQAMQRGGMAPAVLNAANEVAVEAFLTRRMGFLQIAQLVAETLEMAEGRNLLADVDDLNGALAVDAAARGLALNLLDTWSLSAAH